MSNSLQFLRYPLAEQAIHIDFLRLRCGTEHDFRDGIAGIRARTHEAIHAFVAFSEWDAVVVLPSSALYPSTLTEIYADKNVASSVSGTSGYFAYLWEHPINDNWPTRLAHFERSGPSILTSLRFAEWFRHDVGVGAELLFCDYLKTMLADERYHGISAIVAHSLGWNDVILITHAESDEHRLTELLADVRLTTLAKCVGTRADLFSPETTAASQIFAASYTHLLGGFDGFMGRELSLGTLAPKIDSARILVRVAPPHEPEVRKFMDEQRAEAQVTVVPSEMGHYSLSMDISAFTKPDGMRAIAFIADTRKFIGGLRNGSVTAQHEPDSYAETTTIFRFLEPDQKHPAPPVTPIPDEVRGEIATVARVMSDLPHLLHQLGVSSMTSHRFISVLLTLRDHLSDPVRSSVVRHLSRFAETIPDLVRELDSDGIDDLCHVLEYAVGQAIDGIAQFQHDANALGLSGRGGYSRLIVTVEWYIRSMFSRLQTTARLPLITFGLRSGNAGSTRRYQIDIPFNVLFVPSRWHNLLHEIGHLVWQHSFGWMLETLAIYRGMEREIGIEIQRDLWKEDRRPTEEEAREYAADRVHVEFLRSREILRELFPNFLIFALPCGADIKEMDALTLRHMMSLGHPSSVTRELLLAVVMHCLLEIMDKAVRATDPDRGLTEEQRASEWWGVWERLENEKHEERARIAIRAVSEVIKKMADAANGEEASEASKRTMRIARPGMKLQILEAPSFSRAVAESLHSTIQVLAVRARYFRDRETGHLPPELFGKLLSRIEGAQKEQSHVAYRAWIGPLFAEWVHSGQVFPKHRDAFIWSRLLLASREELRRNVHPGSFMRSQLAVLLSMWHDAITQGHTDTGKFDRLVELGIVKPLDAV